MDQILRLFFQRIKKSNLHFIKLLLRVNHEELLAEAKSVDSFYVRHRSDQSVGWYSVTLHGLSSSATEDASKYGLKGDFDGETRMSWTSVSLKTPKIRQFVEGIGFERLGRVRVMRLDPGGSIDRHTDTRNPGLGLAINVALNNPEGCKWYFSDGEQIPFAPGDAFDIDISREHFLRNESSECRYHLIIHPYYYGRYLRLLVKSYLVHRYFSFFNKLSNIWRR